MTLNVPLLEATMLQIEQHPDEHDPSWWARRSACGTTYCFAGTALVLAGRSKDFIWREAPAGAGAEADYLAEPDGAQPFLQDAAQDLLGLTDFQARSLFFDGNTVETLRHEVDALTDGASR